MKIAIFEDEHTDLITRYSQISGKEHQKLIFFVGGTLVDKDFLVTTLEQARFKNYNITIGLPFNATKVPPADLYFLDGLNGDCFSLLSLLPNDRAFVYTNNPDIRDRLRSKGKIVLEFPQDLERILKENQKGRGKVR